MRARLTRWDGNFFELLGGRGMCDATREAEGVGRIGESPTSVARCAGLRGESKARTNLSLRQ